MDVVYLSSPPQLPSDCLPDDLFGEIHHEGPNGKSLLRRRGDEAYVLDPREGDVEGSRYGGRRKGENVHVGAHLFQFLLVHDAEPLLLVDDEKAEIPEHHIALEQPVGPDEDIYPAAF